VHVWKLTELPYVCKVSYARTGRSETLATKKVSKSQLKYERSHQVLIHVKCPKGRDENGRGNILVSLTVDSIKIFHNVEVSSRALDLPPLLDAPHILLLSTLWSPPAQSCSQVKDDSAWSLQLNSHAPSQVRTDSTPGVVPKFALGTCKADVVFTGFEVSVLSHKALQVSKFFLSSLFTDMCSRARQRGKKYCINKHIS